MNALKTLSLLIACLSVSKADVIADIRTAAEKVNASAEFVSVIKAGLALLDNPAKLFQDAVAFVDTLNEGVTLPKVNFDVIWSDDTTVDTVVYPTTTLFSPKMLVLLTSRLQSREPLNPPLKGAFNTYGLNSTRLNGYLDYWLNTYNFRARERYLNSYPQYVTKIQGLNVTFYRATPCINEKNKTVVPIILLHGWPQLNVEYIPIFDGLTNTSAEYDFVFDVIVPSYPGYAFSSYANRPGMSPIQIGYICKTLMNRLGYKQYYVHGGDLGYIVGKYMTTYWPDEVLGFHATMASTISTKAIAKVVIGALEPTLIDKPQYVNRTYPLLTKQIFGRLIETGYLHEHLTKPDNLAGLRDSPTGLAAWIIYMFGLGVTYSSVTSDFDVAEHLSLDQILDILTLHWCSKDAVNAARLYAETFSYYSNPDLKTALDFPSPVPFAALKYLNEGYYRPDSLLRDLYPNLIRSTYYEFGGHFAPMENPVTLTADIFDSVKAFMEFNNKKKA